MHEWIRTLNEEALDLSAYYQPGESRTVTYRVIAAKVLQAAQEAGPTALALYGHPLVLSTLSRMVLAGSEWLGLPSLVVPGISSIDAIVSDLRIDPGDVALQVQEATDLLLYRRPIDPQRGLLLFQPAQAGTWLHSDHTRHAPLRALADYLVAFYPASHVVCLVRSASERCIDPLILKSSLAALPIHGIDLPTDFTLYVPPIGGPQPEAREVREALTDPFSLEKRA
jgi:hypothetical protein